MREIGGKGIRTPGLLIANETLYQLSYTPFYLSEWTQINPTKIAFVHHIVVVGLAELHIAIV